MELNRSRKPRAAGKLIFTLPEIKKYSLENGLQILFVKKDNLPIIQFSMVSNAGSRLDPQDKKGVSGLLAMLLDEGADGMNPLELSDAFESLGSSISVSSDPDSFFISMLTLSENTDKSLDLFSKIITKPNFYEADFEREKRNVITHVGQMKDNAAHVAGEVFERLIYGENNPYGLPDTGTVHSIAKITLEDVKHFYTTRFTPENSTLVIVGSTDIQELLAKLNRLLAEWHTHKPSSFEMTVPALSKTRMYIIHKDDAAQSEIRLGHITTGRNAPDFYAKTVMNNILGGQFSSRINLNLREHKGYTYGAHSSFNYNKVQGYFCTGAAVKSENTMDSIIEIINELNGIITHITEKELRFAKSSITRKYPSLFETYGQIGRNLSNKVIHSLPDDYFNNYIDNIKRITIEGTYQAATENIFPDNLIILAVGDRNIIIPQIKDSFQPEVIELNTEGVISG